MAGVLQQPLSVIRYAGAALIHHWPMAIAAPRGANDGSAMPIIVVKHVIKQSPFSHEVRAFKHNIKHTYLYLGTYRNR